MHGQHAVRAAQHWRAWGKWACVRYCQKRGVPLRLLGLAVALEQVKMNPHEARCLGWHCPDEYRNNCALHVKERKPKEALFQGYPSGELCNSFKPIHKKWGDGKDES